LWALSEDRHGLTETFSRQGLNLSIAWRLFEGRCDGTELRAMVRTRCWIGTVVVLAGCGSGTSSGGAAVAGSASGSPSSPVDSPAATSGASVADWTMPTGVFRSDNPQTGALELHVDVGRFREFENLGVAPELGYAAECVADDPSTVTCTEQSGVQLVFAWSGTDDAFTLTVVQGFDNDRAVWEGAPWIRVP
jgi:hypothetical protein